MATRLTDLQNWVIRQLPALFRVFNGTKSIPVSEIGRIISGRFSTEQEKQVTLQRVFGGMRAELPGLLNASGIQNAATILQGFDNLKINLESKTPQTEIQKIVVWYYKFLDPIINVAIPGYPRPAPKK